MHRQLAAIRRVAGEVTDDSRSLPLAHKESAENEDAETTLSPAEGGPGNDS